MSDNMVSLRLVGKKIRTLRQQKDINITQFAELTGVTSAYISQIERDIIEPSLPVLRKLAHALDVEIPFLFTDEVPSDVLVMPPPSSAEFSSIGGGARYHFMMPWKLKDGSRPDMAVMLVKIPPGITDSPEFVVHDYSEFTTVLEGSVEYQTEVSAHRLFEGDSIFVRKGVRHRLYNPYDVETLIFSVMSSSTHFMPDAKKK